MTVSPSPQFLWRGSRTFDYAQIIIATLGPSGTSSEFAAHHLTESVELFDSYEHAEEYALNHPKKAAFLVANAYQHVNQFYISRKAKPVAAFFLDTPPYVLATRGMSINELPKNTRISSHRAPAHLVEALLQGASFTLVDAYSTSEAARMVADAETDVCLTTQLACDKRNLKVQLTSGTIPMLWTLFASSERYE